jgi:hypothetical protein
MSYLCSYFGRKLGRQNHSLKKSPTIVSYLKYRQALSIFSAKKDSVDLFKDHVGIDQ